MSLHSLARGLGTKSLVFFALAGILIFSAACGDDEPAVVPTTAPVATATPQPEPTAVPAPVVSRLVVVMPPVQLDSNVPWLASGGNPNLRAMYDGMITINRMDGTFEPRLATSWSMSADGTAWTFKLAEGVEFHNGWGEFTAKDVIHDWEMDTSEDSITTGATTFKEIIDSKASFDVVSDHEIVFNLNTPWPDLIPIMVDVEEDWLLTSKNHFDADGQAGMLSNPAGTGAWRQTDRMISDFANYERVDNHWRQTADFPELKIQFVPEDATRMAMMLTEEAHMATIPKDLHHNLLGAGLERIQGQIASGTAWFYFWGGLYFTFEGKVDPDLPVNDVRVRKAMNKAIDRDLIIETIFDGRATPATHISYSEGLAGWDPSWRDRYADEYGFDTAASKALLADAGYPNGFKIKIFDYPYGGAPEIQQMNQVMAQMWGDVGIEVELEATDYALAKKHHVAKTLHYYIMGFPSFGRYEPHIFARLIHYSGGYTSYYVTEELDEKWAELSDTLDLAKRDQIIREVGEILYTQHANMPMVNTFFEAIINPNIVAEYLIPGNYGGGSFTHIEYAKAVKA